MTLCWHVELKGMNIRNAKIVYATANSNSNIKRKGGQREGQADGEMIK